MPTICLPNRPNLEHLQGQARALQRRVRASEAAAVEIVREFHPRPAAVDDPGRFRLADAQLTVARRHGFASWPALRRYLGVVERYSRTPNDLAPGPIDGQPAEELLRLGCLVYGGDDIARHHEARRLLAERPELAGANIWTAAAVGAVAATEAFLAGDGSLASQDGGPFGWAPILYLAYSRIDSDAPGHDVLATARLLLAARADPNAGYLCDGICPFTALTGAFGGGEDKNNQPPHRHALALARLLLEAGADPNDSQALYNRHFDPDASHLRLLIEFGLGHDRGGPWLARLNSAQGAPKELLDDQLSVAATKNWPEWASLALAAGADPNGRGTAHPLRGGLSPYELASRRGNREVARLLAEAGATVPPADPVEQLLEAALAGDRSAVHSLVATDPSLAARAVLRRHDAVVHAAELGRPEAIRLLVGLGFDVNAQVRLTALHQAAYDGDVAVVQTLLELGADPDRRDPDFNSPPLGWAEHARQEAVIEILRPVSTPGCRESDSGGSAAT